MAQLQNYHTTALFAEYHQAKSLLLELEHSFHSRPFRTAAIQFSVRLSVRSLVRSFFVQSFQTRSSRFSRRFPFRSRFPIDERLPKQSISLSVITTRLINLHYYPREYGSYFHANGDVERQRPPKGMHTM